MVVYFPNEWVNWLILHFTFLSFGNLFARLTQINLVYLLGSFTLYLFYLMYLLYHVWGLKSSPEGVTLITQRGLLRRLHHGMSTRWLHDTSDPRRTLRVCISQFCKFPFLTFLSYLMFILYHGGLTFGGLFGGCLM